MTSDYSTHVDQKNRWGGILEIPLISKIQRGCLDGFRVEGLRRALASFAVDEVLEICCGLGEYSRTRPWRYVGLDNSLDHLSYGHRHYAPAHFIHGHAMKLPFKDYSFQAVLFACASHHFDDEGFLGVIREMARISRQYVIVEDCIYYDGQSSLSHFFYKLDRGGMFRTQTGMETILNQLKNFKIVHREIFTTFPNLYKHAVFILEKQQG